MGYGVYNSGGTRLAGFNHQKNIIEGTFCILKTYMALGIQKLGVILENKVRLDSNLTKTLCYTSSLI